MGMGSTTELWGAQAASLQCSVACRAHLLSSRATAEGFHHEIFKVTQRDPSVRAGLAFSLGVTVLFKTK
jgi:hypothetical protein